MASHRSHRKSSPLALTCLLLAFTALPAAGQETWSADFAEPIDEVFKDLDMSGPGCAVGVVADGQLAYANGYGQANMDFGLPITPTSNFYLGSVGKQFTAAVVAHASRAGHLSLDDDIRNWLPEMPEYERTITVSNLIHHTSGVRDFLGLWSMSGHRVDDVNTAEDALATITRQSATNFPAGDEYLYSNSGYFLLGVIVERATGMSLREYAQTHFLGPLGMSRSRFNDRREEIMSERVTGYNKVGDEYVMDHAWNWEIIGAGGMYSNIEDLYRWDQNFYTEQVGGEGFTQQLLERGTLTNGDEIAYAFGLFHGTYRGLKTVSHGGALAGFRTQLLRFPEQHTTVLVLCNIPSAQPSTRARKVADIVLGDRMEAKDEPDAAPAAPDRTPVELTIEQLDAFTGSWTASVGITVEIVREDHQLVFVQSGQRVPVVPIAENVLWMESALIEMTVTEARDGQWIAMDVDQNGSTFTATWNDPATQSPADAPDYSDLVGDYYSEDLDATYTLMMDAGELKMVVPPGRPVGLVSTGDDSFRAGALRMRVDRQGDGVRGFTFGAGRVRGVYFRRVG
jgi:CubicO group peptidase (beta-lactamase class C family)